MILAVGDTVELAHLPETLYASGTSRRADEMCSLSELEKHHIARVIAVTASLQEAAEKLGIDQTTLWRKRKQYGL